MNGKKTCNKLIIGILLLSIACISLIGVAGIKESQGRQLLPPFPDEVQGSLADTNNLSGEQEVRTVYKQWRNFQKQDLSEVKRIVNLAEPENIKDTAFQQWQELWPYYIAWKEHGGKYDKYGIRVYGPIASGWMNEILQAMMLRELIICNSQIDDIKNISTRNKPAPPASSSLEDVQLFSKFNDWFRLGGLTGEFPRWAGIRKNENFPVIHDLKIVSHIEKMLDNSDYPFQNRLFEGTEIYNIPGASFYEAGELNSWTAGLTNTVAFQHGAYSPESIGGTPRVLMVWPRGSAANLPHELGHAWFFNQKKIPLRAANIHEAYAANRRPAVPAKLLEKPDETLTDDINYNEALEGLPWEDRPNEALPEDFAWLFFPGVVNYEWQHNWPNIFSEEDENQAIRDRVKEIFLINSPVLDDFNLLDLDPVRKIARDSITITGTAPPGEKISFYFGDQTTAVFANENGKFQLELSKDMLSQTDEPAVVDVDIGIRNVRDTHKRCRLLLL